MSTECKSVSLKAPFTRYNLLSNRLNEQWLFVQPVWQTAVSCRQTSNRFWNRFDNRLYRANGYNVTGIKDETQASRFSFTLISMYKDQHTSNSNCTTTTFCLWLRSDRHTPKAPLVNMQLQLQSHTVSHALCLLVINKSTTTHWLNRENRQYR